MIVQARESRTGKSTIGERQAGAVALRKAAAICNEIREEFNEEESPLTDETPTV